MRRERFAGRGMLALHASALESDFVCPDLDAKPYAVVDGVAVVPVGFGGPLTQRASWCWDNYDAIKARVAMALADSSARAVVIEVNSPGGDVAGVFELAAELRLLGAKSGKRFVAFTDGMAASAAYAIATATQEIFVTSTGQVGSVGIINALVDVTALDRAQGLKFSVISSGERKKDGNPHVAITEEAESVMRSNVNALASLFFEWVSNTRAGVSAAQLQSFDGALFFGTNAVKVGLANGVTTKTELLATLARESTASAVSKPEAAMADDDKEKKSYADEMRAKLKADAESDDKDTAEAAKKMLAALDGDGDKDADKKAKADDGDGDGEAKKAKADDDKPADKADDGDGDGDAAKATVSASALLDAARTAAKAELDSWKASEQEKAERAVLYASRKDLPDAMLAEFDDVPLAKAKALIARIPVQKLAAKQSAAAQVSGTRGQSQLDAGVVPGLSEEDASHIDRAMGGATHGTGVKRVGSTLELGPMTREQAQARVAELEKGAK